MFTCNFKVYLLRCLYTCFIILIGPSDFTHAHVSVYVVLHWFWNKGNRPSPKQLPPPPSPHTDKHTQNNDIIAWCHELTVIVITENVTKCFICYFTLLRKMKSRGIIQTTKSSDTLRWNSWIICNKRFSI